MVYSKWMVLHLFYFLISTPSPHHSDNVYDFCSYRRHALLDASKVDILQAVENYLSEEAIQVWTNLIWKPYKAQSILLF